MTHSSALIPGSRRRRPALALVLAAAVVAGSCGGPTEPKPPPIPQLTVTCPAGVEAQSADGAPVSVSFSSPTTTGGVAPVTLTCTPPSGSLFNGGTTVVSCSAADARGLSSSCTTSVFVRLPPRLVGAGRVLAFGDSITAGTPGTTATAMSIVTSTFAYPLVLEPMLRQRYRLQTPRVDPEGIPSETAQDGVLRFRPRLQSLRPDIVILMEGTNDVLGFSVGVDRGAAALRTMVQHAKLENVRVLLSTITPQRAGGLRQPPRDPYVPWVVIMNDRIREIATSENVPLVDTYAVFANDMSLIGVDDVHPTQRGYQVMAETFFDAIRQHFEVPQPAGTIR